MPFVDIFKPPMCKIPTCTLWCRDGHWAGGMVGESHSSHWLKWKADPLVSRDRNSRGYPKYHLPTLKNSQVNHWIKQLNIFEIEFASSFLIGINFTFSFPCEHATGPFPVFVHTNRNEKWNNRWWFVWLVKN